MMFADLQVQRLQCAAVALHSLVSSLVKLSSYQAPDLKVWSCVTAAAAAGAL